MESELDKKGFMVWRTLFRDSARIDLILLLCFVIFAYEVLEMK